VPDGATNTGVPDGATADADAPIDALTTSDALVGFDGGRVPYRAIAVATGELHTCAILDDHRVKCWGHNAEGQLGLGDTKDRGGDPSTMGDNLPTVDLGTGRTAIAIAGSRDSTCAILDDGSVKCWGDPTFSGQSFFSASGSAPGEMGDNLSALDFGGRRAVNIGMGPEIACASMDDDTIWCWPGGANPNAAKPSQLTGLPAKQVRALGPSGAKVAAVYDDGTLSADLPDGPIPLPTSGRNAVAVTGSQGNFTCVLFDDGTTACNDGTNGPTNAIAIGADYALAIICVVLTDGDIQCRGYGGSEKEYCASPLHCSSDGDLSSFTLGVPAVAVTSNGSQFMCALLADGNIKCWGAEPTEPWLGASIDFTTEADGGIVYGAWHTVDLGTH
jgi:Regulator of chromosome condensation (RCC1) repeat